MLLPTPIDFICELLGYPGPVLLGFVIKAADLDPIRVMYEEEPIEDETKNPMPVGLYSIMSSPSVD